MAWGNTWGDLAADVAETYKAPVTFHNLSEAVKTAEEILKHDSDITPEMSGVVINQMLLASQVRNNKVPTHDPYTNPNAFIYYSCECGQVLDPNTKSFAALNNAASAAGWKIRWGDNSYVPYCVECGKGIE